ncbi:hypothetical protein [Clostridium sp. C2-6-12]|uniref:hypothetical protein n=1 Tax=Clostridium sp. C2-6-12 TaxID=2698832 RepID=UPI00136EE683|nr:hypothetical protein [Clostridium sp. C2-6-12]
MEILVIRHGQSVADIEGRMEGRADFPINNLFASFIKLPFNTEYSINSGDTGIHLWKVANNQREIIFLNGQEHLLELSNLK